MVELGRDRPGYSWEVHWSGEVLADILRRYLKTELALSVSDSAKLRDIKIAKQDDLGRVEKLVITWEEPDGEEVSQREYEVIKDKSDGFCGSPTDGFCLVPVLNCRSKQPTDRYTRLQLWGKATATA